MLRLPRARPRLSAVGGADSPRTLSCHLEGVLSRTSGKGDAPQHSRQVIHRSADHQTSHALSTDPPQSSSTQVSLVPPPWLELTTSEPFFNATRVSPPGVMRTWSPTST